ncbi:MAG: Flp family type IVb pilin [Planctomycetes bacterium]|nr:Flp family type IVb pilin [Planctomycetota bacterium]
MSSFVKRAKQFLKSEDGPTATEYAVMLALIIVACIGAITTLGGSVSGMFDSLSDTLIAVPTS